MNSFKPPTLYWRVLKKYKNLVRSIWFFPAILLLPLIAFTILEINGSSIGIYHKLFYGEQKDPHLVLNEPRAVRSDEWLVNTQQTIAQSTNGFPRVNDHIGNGQDMSVTDAPNEDWSTLFRPHNIPFLFLPLDNAFAFKWWLMGFLIITSCYLFILTLLPKRRLLAASLSLALFFSAFIQWWYVYGTLGSIYYSLFILTVVIHINRQQNTRKKIMLSALLAYLVACFGLVLYPPFQIACGLIVATFLLGYAIQEYIKNGKSSLIKNTAFVLVASLAGAIIVGAFVFSRMDVVNTINNTAYPGKRSLESGNYFPEHFLSSHLGHQFLSPQNTSQYLIDDKQTHTNQSESSNFLLLAPFLLVPSLLVLYMELRRKLTVNWPLLGLNILFIVFILQLFVPAFTPISKLLLLDKVGDARLLIGMGLVNIATIALLIKSLSKKAIKFPSSLVITYCLIVLAIELILAFQAHYDFGSFIGEKRAFLFSLPVPIILFLLFTKRFVLAIFGYLAFSIFISLSINPLYKGLDTITKSPLSVAVSEIGANSNKRWVTDDVNFENIASMNGERSLSGVYNYPQIDLWSSVPGAETYDYNRYAHVGFQILDDPHAKTELKLVAADNFLIKTNPCSEYLRKLEVGFIVTHNNLKSNCVKLEKALSFPTKTIRIYSVRH